MYMLESVEENLRFLIFEVQKQLERTNQYIRVPSLELLDSILTRDDYIDNLKTIIQRKCFSTPVAPGEDEEARAASLKAIVVVAANLENIADFCEKSIRQLAYIEDQDILEKYDFQAFFTFLNEGIRLVESVILDGDASQAIKICRIEHDIDEIYADMFARILNDLSKGRKTQSLVTTLFIARYLERMGDSLLNIGEAAMSAFLGDQIKIGQFDVLEQALDQAALNPGFTDLSITAMGETKSGCRIDLVSSRNSDDSATMVIFKEGRREKLANEKTGVEYWNALMPGIAPAIYAHHQKGDTGALLFEYLGGSTYEQLLLQADTAERQAALTRISETLSAGWRKTRQNTPGPVDFVGQVRARLPDIFSVHPDFSAQHGHVGGVAVPSFQESLELAERVESKLISPFQVLVHGDFNIDNVIYDAKSGRVRFIDLHRAEMKDYVQDVSVFLVSNFRLQVYDPDVRERINRTVLTFKRFASAFAREAGDDSFEIRLALGVARSFVTSTRFVLDNDFAQNMLLRSRYLLEDIVSVSSRRHARYRLPEEVLID